MLRALLTYAYAADVCGRMLTCANADRLSLLRALRPPTALRSLLMQVGARGMRVERSHSSILHIYTIYVSSYYSDAGGA
jgi:hypothetical protein